MKAKVRKRLINLMWVVVALVMVAYLSVFVPLAVHSASDRMCTGVQIAVHDTASLHFVTAAELGHELDLLPAKAKMMHQRDINTDSLERILNAFDKIENATVVRLTNGKILVDVSPMRPVARIFDREGSYYINKDGKRISADARYHVDVPVIEIADSAYDPLNVLPLVNYITADSVWSHFVSMIKVDHRSDVILVPMIRGQVVNFGTPDDFDDKFRRLSKMYSKVLPTKGWTYYDTISVKWHGQVVATRARKQVAEAPEETFEDDESVDISTMMVADGVAPGQIKPGVEAHNDRPIPKPEYETNNQ